LFRSLAQYDKVHLLLILPNNHEFMSETNKPSGEVEKLCHFSFLKYKLIYLAKVRFL
jgi:hypothetical protein